MAAFLPPVNPSGGGPAVPIAARGALWCCAWVSRPPRPALFWGVATILRILLIILLLAGLVGGAEAAGRVALVIGNADYRQPELVLRNPGNDAGALADALSAEGFSVTLALEKDVVGMRTVLDRFGEAAEGAEVALFFFAGHGVQMAGDNYFLGVDFAGQDGRAAQEGGLSLTEVRQVLARSRAEATLIIIDACRNTPFSESGVARPGLVRARGGAGMLIAYATDPGNVALDGEGENSVFTRALLDNLGTPGLDVRLMLGRVRQQVVLETAGLQVPWVEEALLGDFVISATPPPETAADAVEEEVRRWRQVAGSVDPAAVEGYLRDYPEGIFASVAAERLRRLSASDVQNGDAAGVQLASADPAGLAAALDTLGLLSRGMEGPAPDPAELAAAFGRYGAQLPGGEAASVDRLFADATRSSLVLAATTAQRIRTDIVALRSVDRAMGIARDALREVEEIAARNPAAEPVLEQARADFAAIEEARATILRRLDQSRNYYQTILTQAARFVPESAGADLLGVAPGTRAAGGIDVELRRFAELFLSQIARASGETEGSYAWLADFAQAE